MAPTGVARFRARLPITLAVRDLRASPLSFLLASLAILISVAGVYGIRSTTAAFKLSAVGNARLFIAADIAVYLQRAPTSSDLNAVRRMGLESVVVTEMGGGVTSPNSPDPAMVLTKIVDPSVYPLYGTIRLSPPASLNDALGPHSAVVTGDLLEALHIKVGDTIRMQDAELSVRGVIEQEPDRFAGVPTLSPRMIVSEQCAESLPDPAYGAVFSRVLLKIPRDADRVALDVKLENLFPDGEVVDYTTPTPQMSVALDWIVPFMDALAVLALAFGAVATGVVAYLRVLQRIETIAILKAVGATSAQIVASYLFQILLISGCGGLAGAVVGRAVEFVFDQMALRIAGAPLESPARLETALETVAIAVLSSLIAALIPLLRIRRIPASAVLREDTRERDEIRHSLLRGRGVEPAALVLGAFLGVFWLLRLIHSGIMRIYLIGAIAVSFALAYWLGRASIAAFSSAVRKMGPRAPNALRHGALNLFRYQRQTRVAVVTMAIAVGLALISLLGQRDIARMIFNSIPFHAPDFWVLNLDHNTAPEVAAQLGREPGLTAPPVVIPSVWLALDSANGVKLTDLRARRQEWIQRLWPATCSETIPERVRVAEGHWWNPGTQQDLVALDENIARLFGVGVGDTVAFLDPSGVPGDVRVAALIDVPPVERFWYQVTATCHVFENRDAIINAGISVGRPYLESVRRDLNWRYSTLPVVNAADMLRSVQSLARQAAAVSSAIAGFILLSSIFTMAAITRVLGTFRSREIAIIRALGGPASFVRRAYSLEHLALGAIAGTIGAACGCAILSVIMTVITWHRSWLFDFPAVVMGIVGAAVLIAAAALAGVRPFLRTPPFEVLRQR